MKSLIFLAGAIAVGVPTYALNAFKPEKAECVLNPNDSI